MPLPKPGCGSLTDGAPNAREVQAAQETADGRGAGTSADESADVHKELLHILVTAFGINGVRRMLDELE